MAEEPVVVNPEEQQLETLEAEKLLTPEQESMLSVVWKRFRRHKMAMGGMFILLIFVLMALFAKVIAPYDPITYRDPYNKNAKPSAEHLLGTDELGRDVFSRLVYAARISLSLALVVVLVSESFGALIGGISGYFGGWVDSLIQRIVEFLLTLPLLPMLLAFSSLLRGIKIPGVDDMWSSVVIIGAILIIFGWMGACRLARGMILSLRNLDFTDAARALGMSNLGIIVRHMLPNALAPIIVNATLGLGGVIIYESALSFLGFGIQPPVPTWGNMLQSAQQGLLGDPAKIFYPGLAIFLTSVAFNYVGDGLRDALDPRLKL